MLYNAQRIRVGDWQLGLKESERTANFREYGKECRILPEAKVRFSLTDKIARSLYTMFCD